MTLQCAVFHGFPVCYLTEEQRKSSNTPFEVIRKIVSNEKSWSKILAEASEIVGTPLSKTTLTDCAINQIALNLLFIGKERTEALFEKIVRNFTYLIEGHVNGQKKDIYLIHLLSGNKILALNEESPFHKDAERDDEKAAEEFVKTIPLSALSTNPRFDKSFYGHNTNVLNRLKSEIILNEKDVLFDCSIIYSVVVSSPTSEVFKHGTINQIQQDSKINHAFILEQYRSESGNIFIRLHNSWSNEYSLSEFYKIQNYNDGDKGCFSSQETQTFLDYFGKMLCCGDFELERLNEYQYYCFKVLDIAPSPLPFVSRSNEGIFDGISLRYMTSKINPITLTSKLESTFEV